MELDALQHREMTIKDKVNFLHLKQLIEQDMLKFLITEDSKNVIKKGKEILNDLANKLDLLRQTEAMVVSVDDSSEVHPSFQEIIPLSELLEFARIIREKALNLNNVVLKAIEGDYYSGDDEAEDGKDTHYDHTNLNRKFELLSAKLQSIVSDNGAVFSYTLTQKEMAREVPSNSSALFALRKGRQIDHDEKKEGVMTRHRSRSV